MELDDLKAAWKRQTEQGAKHVLSDAELHAMLKVKTRTTIDLLKKSVRFEFYFSLLCIIACILALCFSADYKIRIASGASGILIMAFSFYYFNKLRLINNLYNQDQALKENLLHLIKGLEKYLLFSRWGYNILLPVSLLSGALFGLHVATEKNLIELLQDVKLWLIPVVLLIPLAVLFNFGLKWYLKMLYGNYLVRLKAILGQLQD